MSTDVKAKAKGALETALGHSKKFAVNTMRRSAILGRYTLAGWQEKRIRGAQRRVGREVLQALEQGAEDPMQAPGVKNALEKAEAMKAGKEKQYQAIQGIKEKIRNSRVSRAPAGAEEAPPVQEAAPAEEATPAQESPPAEEKRPPEEGTPGSQ